MVTVFYLPLSGMWKAVPFRYQLTTTAFSPAAWISLSLLTSVMAPSLSPHSSFLTDLTMRRAAMWVRRQSSLKFAGFIHLCFLIYIPTVKLEHAYKTFGLYNQVERRKSPSKTFLNTWELCILMAFYFSVRGCVWVRGCAFSGVLFTRPILVNDKRAQIV